MSSQVKIGSYVGTGAAINIELGFVPQHVRIVNETDADAVWEWFFGMTAAHAINLSGAAPVRITVNGVTALEPTNYSGKKGFTAGSALSESGKTFRYIAMRSGTD
jgi:hypothetical protein